MRKLKIFVYPGLRIRGQLRRKFAWGEHHLMEAIGKMKPAFKAGGSVTAANASGINDGAAAVVLMSREKADALGVKPLLSIKSQAVIGNNPDIMGFAPAMAIKKAVAKA